MTAKEKLKLEHPEKYWADTGYCSGCPDQYGYLEKPDTCGNGILPNRATCDACWGREIPTVEEVNGMFAEPHILDSGDRTEFESGAVRDMRKGKGRCDLLPLDVVWGFMTTFPVTLPVLKGLETTETDQDLKFAACIFDYIHKFQENGDLRNLYEVLGYATYIWGDLESHEAIATMFLEVAIHFEEGALKYGDNNWRKGIPVRCYIDSAIRHYLKFLRGDKDEPHDRAFCWNILCAIWTCKHKPELNDYAKDDAQ